QLFKRNLKNCSARQLKIKKEDNMNKTIHAVFLVLACLAVTSCKSVSKASSNEKPLFSLFRTACFGTCPSYTIEIFEDGRAVYNGLLHTEPLGRKTIKLTSSQLRSLKQRFKTLNIVNAAELYPQGEPIPQDIPSIIISSNVNGISKKTEIKGILPPDNLNEWINELENLKNKIVGETQSTR
ncbi:MAG: DUF6438 domain-containing protein, partial [Chitinophagales bacterium]|nr:DUF6438 domain-containing protein [Chitinophagales bacterium]